MGTFRLMLIDDDPMLLQVLPQTLTLKLPNLSIETYTRNDAALRRLESQPFSVILADVVMPGMEASHFLSESLARRPDTPVIFMTGRLDDQMGQKLVENGAFDLLWKPLDRKEVIAVIECALDAYALQSKVATWSVKSQQMKVLLANAEAGALSTNDTLAAAVRRTLKRSTRAVMLTRQLLRQKQILCERRLRLYQRRLEAQITKARSRAQSRVYAFEARADVEQRTRPD